MNKIRKDRNLWGRNGLLVLIRELSCGNSPAQEVLGHSQVAWRCSLCWGAMMGHWWGHMWWAAVWNWKASKTPEVSPDAQDSILQVSLMHSIPSSRCPWSTTQHHPAEVPHTRETPPGYLGVPTWIWVNINPVDVVFWRFLPSFDGSSLWPLFWPSAIKITLPKSCCEAFGWWDSFILGLSFLCIFLGDFCALVILLKLTAKMPVYLSSFATKLFYNKPYMSIVTKKPLIQGHLTLIHPKGFINKNLGYPPLLE